MNAVDQSLDVHINLMISMVRDGEALSETESQLATYIEAEWSDYLFKDERKGMAPLSKNDPAEEYVDPHFYRAAAKWTSDLAKNIHLSPSRYCDVGGATGRTLFEIYNLLPDISELVLVEPAPHLSTFAKHILLRPEALTEIPVVGNWKRPFRISALNRPKELNDPSRTVTICDANIENISYPCGYFDIITCFNVIDRHECPKKLIATLYDLLSPLGLLIVASPLEFFEMFTPKREHWVSDLQILFSNGLWESIDEHSFLYDIRQSRRKWIRYNTQIVAQRKRTR